MFERNQSPDERSIHRGPNDRRSHWNDPEGDHSANEFDERFARSSRDMRQDHSAHFEADRREPSQGHFFEAGPDKRRRGEPSADREGRTFERPYSGFEEQRPYHSQRHAPYPSQGYDRKGQGFERFEQENNSNYQVGPELRSGQDQQRSGQDQRRSGQDERRSGQDERRSGQDERRSGQDDRRRNYASEGRGGYGSPFDQGGGQSFRRGSDARHAWEGLERWSSPAQGGDSFERHQAWSGSPLEADGYNGRSQQRSSLHMSQHIGRGPKGYQRSDERITEELCDELTRHPAIDATEIEIKVESGEVKLTGYVQSRQEKRLVEDISESVLGVKQVHNQIRVMPLQPSEPVRQQEKAKESDSKSALPESKDNPSLS